jgi:hypothetical protein
VNKFLYGLNTLLKEKMHIFMPTTLHEEMKKVIIVEEEMQGSKRGDKNPNPIVSPNKRAKSIRYAPTNGCWNCGGLHYQTRLP